MHDMRDPRCGRRLLEDVGVAEFVHQLHLLQHVGPIGVPQVHLQHHHLAGSLVHHLKSRTCRSDIH